MVFLGGCLMISGWFLRVVMTLKFLGHDAPQERILKTHRSLVLLQNFGLEVEKNEEKKKTSTPLSPQPPLQGTFCPAPMATPTSAAAKAGASLMPHGGGEFRSTTLPSFSLQSLILPLSEATASPLFFGKKIWKNEKDKRKKKDLMNWPMNLNCCIFQALMTTGISCSLLVCGGCSGAKVKSSCHRPPLPQCYGCSLLLLMSFRLTPA